jgi:endonuclease/exonuclease/phosphatase family metal-dependent hydrolase
MKTAIALASLLSLGLLSAPAQAQEPPQESVTFASFNICKVNCAAPAPPWEVRRDRVSRVIGESGASIIGLQESTNNKVDNAKTQALDVAQLVAAHGYVVPVVESRENQCQRPRDEYGQLAGPNPCDNTTQLLYKATDFSQTHSVNGSAMAGTYQLGNLVAGQDPSSAKRSVQWAYLRSNTTGKDLLAISLHTDNDKSDVSERSREIIGEGLDEWVAQKNQETGMVGVPAVLMTDLNSFDKRQPNGVQQRLRNNGWVDSFNAPTKKNIQYSTINYSKYLDVQGFPAKPYKFKKTKNNPLGAATRIDYVFVLSANASALEYEVVIYLDNKGNFIPDYQASDHQMVKAKVTL